MPPSLRIAQDDLDVVWRHAREGAPDEVCGVLLGRREGGDVLVTRVQRVRNASVRPREEYLLAPEEMLRVILAAEADGLDAVGFYHSHPAGPARMSGTDHARASWPGAAYVLVWLAPEEGVGCWTWDEARRAFAERTLVVEGA